MEPPRPKTFDFHGVCMTEVVTGNWDNVQNFKARPDDILIVTYPKAGTTWISYILDLLYFGHMGPDRQASVPINKRVPFLEMAKRTLPTGTESINQLTTTPRLIKSHLPVQFVPKSFWEQRCKIVYVARNAKDCAVSFFHFGRMNKSQPDPGDWSSYLEKYMEGQVMYGSWFDHVINWWEKKQTCSNIHFTSYEDLSKADAEILQCEKDLGGELDRLCAFLGLSPSAEEKENLKTAVKFDNMKENNMVNYSSVPSMDHKVSPFMRKGKVADWKNHFTVAQNEKFDEVYKQKMKNCTLKISSEI